MFKLGFKPTLLRKSCRLIGRDTCVLFLIPLFSVFSLYFPPSLSPFVILFIYENLLTQLTPSYYDVVDVFSFDHRPLASHLISYSHSPPISLKVHLPSHSFFSSLL